MWPYVPKTAWDRSLPLSGSEVSEIRAELKHAREQAGGAALAAGWEVEALERIYVLAAKRQIEELALFRDYTLHYAQVDGWCIEELQQIQSLPRQKQTADTLVRRTDPVRYSELDEWRQLVVRSLRLQARGAICEVNEVISEAKKEMLNARTGAAGADLVSANVEEVIDVFLRAGLGQLCDGTSRAPDDELVIRVSQSLRGTEANAVLRRATWLQLDLKGKGEKPVRTIGSVVRSLGGISEDKKVGPRGEQKRLYRWLLPGDNRQDWYPITPNFL